MRDWRNKISSGSVQIRWNLLGASRRELESGREIWILRLTGSLETGWWWGDGEELRRSVMGMETGTGTGGGVESIGGYGYG